VGHVSGMLSEHVSTEGGEMDVGNLTLFSWGKKRENFGGPDFWRSPRGNRVRENRVARQKRRDLM